MSSRLVSRRRLPIVVVGVLLMLVGVVVGVLPAGAATSGPLTWGKPKPLDPLRGGFASVSCVSRDFCLAGDQNGKVVKYRNGVWSNQAQVDTEHSGIGQMACVSSTFCAASRDSREGASAPLIFNGTSWRTGASSEEGSSDVSCVTARFCMLVTAGGTHQRYNGSTWSAPRRFPGDTGFGMAISCATTTFCMAVDANGRAIKYRSGWLRPRTVDPNHSLLAVSCPKPAWCMAVDRDGGYLRYHQGTWSPRRSLGTGAPIAVSCPRAGWCTAVDTRGTAHLYSSGTWHRGRRVARAALIDVSCPSVHFCLTVSVTGEAVARTDGGWGKPAHPDPALGGLQAVSCASATFCLGVDGSGGQLTFDGSSWSKARRLNYYSAGFVGVSCARTWFCMALDSHGHTHRRLHGHWSRPMRTHITPGSAVSCASPTLCAVVNYYGSSSIYDGSAWRRVRTTDRGGLVTVSCTWQHCFAGDTEGGVVRYADGAWGEPRTIAPPPGFDDISCVGRFCIAVAQGKAYRYHDGHWSTGTRVFRSGTHAVSCTSATFCVAVHNGGESTFNGATWTRPQVISPATDFLSFLVDVSCAGKSLCVAFDSNHDTAIVAS